MTKTERAVVHHAADIIDQYAEELRRSHVVNGAWNGEGVVDVRDEWADMITTVRQLRAIAGARPCF